MSLRPAKTIPIPCPTLPSPKAEFSLSAYHARMEKLFAALESQGDEEACLILWWGKDGLRLNRDGTREWIRKPVPKDRLAAFSYARLLADIETPPTCCSYRRN